MSRLIIISNRLPFSIESQDDQIKLRQSSGGLVSALKSFFERDENEGYTERIWMGSMDGTEKEWHQIKLEGYLPKDFKVEPLFPEAKSYKNYYNGFSNSTLWPLFHYFPMLVEFKKEYFEDYRQVNQMFADRVHSSFK